jgi:hypothetical protein
MIMTDTSKPAATGGTSSAAPGKAAGTGPSAGSGIQIGFILEFCGAAAVVAAAFFSPLPERIAVLAGVASFAVGRFFPRIV